MSELLTCDLAHWAATTPDAEAISYAGRSHTWAQWHARIQRVSAALADRGVGHGDRVAFLDKNHLACLEVTLGASDLGAANTVVNFRLAPDELAYVLGDCGARLVFVGAEFAPVLRGLDLPDVEQIVVVGGESDEYEPMLAAAPAAGPAADVDPDDTCLILYSSGTTGFPKGVMLTHRGMTAHTRAAGHDFVFGPGSRNLVAMPLFHVGGSSYAMIGIRAGVPTTLVREPDGPSLLGAISQGATHAFLVPAVVAAILQAGDPAIAAFGRMTHLGYGASPMPLPVLRRALAAWPQTNFIQVYGMTECSGVLTTLDATAHRDEQHPERLVSAGRPIPGVEMRVVDPVTGEDVAPGEPGELWFRTAQRMAGYWGNPQATADTVTPDGWVRSGDVGRVDDGGFVTIVDRVKDMIISGGENIYSPEVERVLAEHPGVGEVAVVGVPDERWGEAVKAFVAPLPGTAAGDLDPDALIAFCREHLAHYKCPASIEILASLPRNATGKILKRRLREPYWAGRDRHVS